MSTQVERKRRRTRGDHRAGAVSVAGPRKAPLRWLPWAVFLLLALIAAGVALIVTNVTDENDEPGLELRDDEVANADEAGSTSRRDGGAEAPSSTISAATPAQGAAPFSTSRGGPAPTTTAQASPEGTLRAGQEALLPLPSSGLDALSGQPVLGQGVLVESVVADEGFWVGSATERIFVHLSPEARTVAGESPFQVAAGQRIDLEGTLEPVADDSSSFGVDDAEGAAQLQSLGHYVEATRIALR